MNRKMGEKRINNLHEEERYWRKVLGANESRINWLKEMYSTAKTDERKELINNRISDLEEANRRIEKAIEEITNLLVSQEEKEKTAKSDYNSLLL